MTDTSDKFDRLPHELEPAGAIQPATCTWTRDNLRNHNTTCGETWPAFITLPKANEPCPWCGKSTRIEGAP